METMKHNLVIESTRLVNETWTNGHYELEVHLNKLPSTDIVEEILYEDENCQLVYGENNGFITYGSISKRDEFGHKAGYRWSSRASVFNGTFGKMGVDKIVYIVDGNKRYSGCMNANLVLKFLPHDFYIIEQVETDNRGKVMEISYYITNEKHEKEKSWYYGDITYSSGAKRYIRRRITHLNAMQGNR